MSNFDKMMADLNKEVRYRTSKSSGAGGQHVNKVSTKVELIFDVEGSEILSEHQKQVIFVKLDNRISNDGVLHLQCDETRSQFKNKEVVFRRFMLLINNALKPDKPRKKTKPSKGSKEKRLADKRKISEKKESRKTKADE